MAADALAAARARLYAAHAAAEAAAAAARDAPQLEPLPRDMRLAPLGFVGPALAATPPPPRVRLPPVLTAPAPLLTDALRALQLLGWCAKASNMVVEMLPLLQKSGIVKRSYQFTASCHMLKTPFWFPAAGTELGAGRLSPGRFLVCPTRSCGAAPAAVSRSPAPRT